MTPEAQLRQQLGIPDSATQVIILCSTAHLDWDWLATFAGYYSSDQHFDNYTQHAVRDVFALAAKLLDANKSNTAQACLESNPSQNQLPPYYYSIAEIGYLQKFASDQPGFFQTLQNVGWLLRIVGGGITSPDNLLSHGETLLRNFLIANTWLLSSFPANPSSGLPALPPLQQVWTPDDFGHDSQFPILMEAMGLQGVGFSRIPGDPQQYNTFGQANSGLSGRTTQTEMAAWLLVFGDENGDNKGVDFIWQAADLSTTVAHFMQGGYFQGASITGTASIQQYYNTNQGASPTPYIFVPVGVDFSLPVTNLLQYACAWNAANFDSTNIYAVAATFDHYIQLVNCYKDVLLTRSSNPDPTNNIFSFVPTPYWTGCYGSRPAIKIQHQQATRALLGAEIFSVVAQFLAVPDSGVVSEECGQSLSYSLDDGWEALTPSTHHDYITGTAANSVYTGEQLQYLANALCIGSNLLTKVQQEIASMVEVTATEDQVFVTVFNQLGFARGGLVEVAAIPGFTPFAFGDENGPIGPVQISSDGTWLFSIPSNAPFSVPALGYYTYYITSDQNTTVPPFDADAAGTLSTDQSTAELSNAYVSATITEAAAWGIDTLDALVDGNSQPVLSGAANLPIYFSDDRGNMYKFGTELGQNFNEETSDFTLSSVQLLESGPVRARLNVTGSYSINNANQQLTREYQLVVDEPFLRMETTGAAPQPYSVFVAFPFSNSGAVDSIEHGTPYHWDTKPAQPVVNQQVTWQPPFFEATQQFIIPLSGETRLGAIYHAHLPAWAVTADNNSLIGCLLRNPNNQNSDNDGGDPDPHTVEYALRIPQGLDDPTTGTPLRESLSYTTPLAALVAGSSPAASLPSTFSMATLSDASFFITAVKPGTVPEQTEGEIIIRVYQPTNAGQSVSLTLPDAPAGQQWAARGVTALELELDANKQTTLNLSVTDNQISFFAERALTTLALSLSEIPG
ncbi:MAG: hypothetical protein AABN95_08405 [Acidobacteriota bacterium]